MFGLLRFSNFSQFHFEQMIHVLIIEKKSHVTYKSEECFEALQYNDYTVAIGKEYAFHWFIC